MIPRSKKKNTILAALAAAVLGMLMSTLPADAQWKMGGFHKGGFHGGFHRGFHGGFAHRGFHGGFHRGFVHRGFHGGFVHRPFFHRAAFVHRPFFHHGFVHRPFFHKRFVHRPFFFHRRRHHFGGAFLTAAVLGSALAFAPHFVDAGECFVVRRKFITHWGGVVVRRRIVCT